MIKEWGQTKPLLSDVLEVNEEFRGVIEAYLEPYLNYFIIDDIAEARSSITLLESTQKGKAKFFILSSFENSPAIQILHDHLGRPALDVVNCSNKYDALLRHLLGNVVIVDESKIMSTQFPGEDVTYISEVGLSNRTRHSISGGSTGLFDGKRLGRRQELTKLKASIETLDKEIEQIQASTEEFTRTLDNLNLESVLSELEELAHKNSQIEISRAQVVTQIDSATSSMELMEGKLSEFVMFFQSNSKKIEAFGSELAEIETKIEEKREIVSSQSGALEDIAAAYGETTSRFNNTQLNWVQHQNEVESLTLSIKTKNDQLDQANKKLNETKTETEAAQRELQNTDREIGVLKDRLVEKYTSKENSEKELNSTEQEFFGKRSVVSEKEKELKSLGKESQDLQLTINNLKDESTGLGFELRSGLDRLKIEFNIDVKNLDKQAILDAIDDKDALQVKYEKTQKRIQNYGEINPMAVEAYDEISERFIDMESQRNDIIEAKSSLLQTIKEIDEEAKGKFLDAFYKAKENFQVVFRSLFSNEDDCDLVMFDPDNPLNSGIEIIAKPKGKRPKVLNQLSGGEKTLTATALLFSLYLLKPAPFCIFDEVDAPLDDYNIQKFSKLIRSFADESQFIIITHNKSTMANVDLLYGVYMQEQGVSGITEVDFKEYEHNEVLQKVSLN